MSDNPTPKATPDPNADDARLTCWLDGEPAVAVAPRHSGGDIDCAAHWIPVCLNHALSWWDQTARDERLPMFELPEQRAYRAEAEYERRRREGRSLDALQATCRCGNPAYTVANNKAVCDLHELEETP
jgi:hypothetical protein